MYFGMVLSSLITKIGHVLLWVILSKSVIARFHKKSISMFHREANRKSEQKDFRSETERRRDPEFEKLSKL